MIVWLCESNSGNSQQRLCGQCVGNAVCNRVKSRQSTKILLLMNAEFSFRRHCCLCTTVFRVLDKGSGGSVGG